VYDLKALRPRKLGPKVRIGKKSDGGYVLLEEQVKRTTTLLSFGVASDWSFEEEFHACKPGVFIKMFDYSTSFGLILARLAAKTVKFQWAKAAHYAAAARSYRAFIGGHPNVEFRKKFLGLTDTGRDVSFGSVVANTPEGELYVKLDVEGAEYDLLPEIVRHADRVVGLAIEFHDLDTRAAEFATVMRLLDARFHIVHLHGNNYAPLIHGTKLPAALEMTLANKSISGPTPAEDRAVYPVAGLDYPNDPSKPDYLLDFS
jgi:hypothetical protein